MQEKYNIYNRGEEMFSRYDTEDILSSVLEIQLFHEVGKEDHFKIQKAEWIVGNLINYNITNSEDIYDYSAFLKLEKIAEDAILGKIIPDAFEDIDKKTEATDEEKQKYLTSISMKLKNQVHRGDGYLKQLITFAERLYSEFDDSFLEELGFTYTFCQEFFIYVFQQYSFRLIQLFKEKATIRFMAKSLLNVFLKKKPLINQSIQSGYVFRLYKKDLYEALGENEVKAIIHELGVNLGNKKNKYKEIGDFNLLYKKPIINFEDYIYVPLPIITLQNLPKIFHYYFIADKRFKPKIQAEYKKHRGDVVEELAAIFLARLFHVDNIYHSLKYDKDKEADLTVQEEDVTIFCECKGKILTLPSLQGNIESIEDDFNKAIKEGFKQAQRTKRHIKEGREFIVTSFLDNKSTILLDNTNKKYIVCVVAEHFGRIPSDIKEFLKPDDSDGLLPIVTNIFDLDIITQECTNKEQFIIYLQNRLDNFGKISSSDELECFVLLKQQQFRDVSINYDTLVPIGYTDELDKKYNQQSIEWILNYQIK